MGVTIYLSTGDAPQPANFATSCATRLAEGLAFGLALCLQKPSEKLHHLWFKA